MTKKIYLVTYASYTESDNYLYNDVKVFTDEEEARHEFISLRDGAYLECQYGASWDEVETMSDEEREDVYQYTVDSNESETACKYTSDAYEGYAVEVQLVSKEIEI